MQLSYLFKVYLQKTCVYYTDFATGDKGHIIDLLGQIWGTDYNATWERIVRELSSCGNVKINTISHKPIIETLSRELTVL